MNNTTSFPKSPAWHEVKIEGGFWGERQATNRERTIPAIYHQTKLTGRLDAWKLEWKIGQPNPPHIFWDSDTAKWIEAVAYSVATQPNPDFERQVDEVIDWIAEAQLEDGYANSHFIAVEPENRWRNLRDQHELYCAGHMIEAAVTYFEATGKRKLLDVVCRYADHIDRTFGAHEGQKRGYCGHPELELALVRLFHATGERRYFELAKYFIDERGQQPHYYDLEARARGEDPRKFWAKDYTYCQAHVPIREQSNIVGHSVRALYLFSAVTDVALETGDDGLLAVARTLWDDLTQRQTYVTGGVGSIHTIEGFTFPYNLPNETAYSETCASIALAYWAQRLFKLDPDSRYIDAMELALYNAMMSGVSYEGSLFFQANPLEAYPKVSPYELFNTMMTGDHYQRTAWFDVACCPSNLARMVASVGAYFYAVTPDRLYVQLYNQSHTKLIVGGQAVQIEQHTNYPWEGEVTLTLTMEQPTRFELALRIPRWCREYGIEVNGAAVPTQPERGYVVIEREWQTGDTIRLVMAMPIERMVAHPHIRQDAGRVALQRGPIVYCVEEADNGAALASIALPHEAALTYAFDNTLFGGVGTITGEAVRIEPVQWNSDPYVPASAPQAAPTPFVFKAIPYCFWANRQPGEMRVWLLKT
ncbi:MAG: glycoside hydrolase family 127 protein [Anaerolineae bacterium]|nr:glycoside hydrolase family 127 protein [Anaerolineae bacterium]